jgi:signal transduction histidine kinase
MVNEATAHGTEPFGQKILEQADIMRDQVARHLERARLAAGLTVVGSVTQTAPVVTALARTMEKIHRDKNLTIDVHADETAQFNGERPDLEEMVGNLVDNACKWASSRVAIEVVRERLASERQVVRIIVDDDGRGLSPSEREQVAKRGRRLDETKPGSGLGLSIVLELAGLYGGGLTFGAAPLGGLRAELVLPAV